MIIFPSKTMLNKISVIVKNRREDIHMSQMELAKGICTQTTISTLENRGCFKAWHIIPQLFEKLDLDIDDIENKFAYRYGENKLEKVEKSLLIHNFNKAQKRLKEIKQENLDTKDLLARYECCSGFIDLLVNQNYDDTISNFNFAINHHQTRDNQIVIGWCYLGIAFTYRKLNLKKQTKYNLNLAVKKMNLCLKKKFKEPKFSQLIHFSLTLLVALEKSDEHEFCLEESRLVINKLKQTHSFYCLRDFYTLCAECLVKLDQKEKAAEYFKRAEYLQVLYSYSNFKRLNSLLN